MEVSGADWKGRGCLGILTLEGGIPALQRPQLWNLKIVPVSRRAWYYSNHIRVSLNSHKHPKKQILNLSFHFTEEETEAQRIE